MAKDYYEILGIAKSASQDEIKKAFRKKAHELHPDKGGDEVAFKQVNEAYQVLGDAKKRATYDQFGHAAFQNGGGPGGFGGFGGAGFDGMNINFEDLGDLGDVLGSMFGFGGARRGARSKRGKDVEVQVHLDFMEAYTGIKKNVHLRVMDVCDACGGNGAAQGAKIETCSACQGKGSTIRMQQTPFGAFQTQVPCPSCRGKGSAPSVKCSSCDGEGVRMKEKEVVVDIPAGIDHGETIRVNGAGEAMQGGSFGDLYVHVAVSSHAAFLRKGNDIHSEAFVAMTAFYLGGTVSVKSIEGNVDLKVPAGTRAGTVFKLKGLGFPYLHGRGKGDQYVMLYPEVPKHLSKEQKKALEDLKGLGL